MPKQETIPVVGRVLNSSAVGYCFGCSAPRPAAPTLGAFVTTTGGGTASIMGVITDIRVEDDMFARQLVSETTSDTIINDQRTFRMVPLEVDVLHTGYFLEEGSPRHRLPPQPPVALESVQTSAPAEVRAFLAHAHGGWNFTFLNLLLASEVSSAVLAGVIWQAAAAQAPDAEARFRQEAARELARLMAGDLQQLYALLPQLNQ
jgi:hypothetical protein